MRLTRRHGAAALIVLLPFAVRAIYLLETLRRPYLQWNFLVAFVNHTLAWDLALGRGAPYSLYRSPGYPILVSWIYRIAGVEPMAVRVVQWILGACGCLLVLALGRRILGARAGLAAFVIASLFIPAVCYEGELLEQPIAAFLLLAAVALLVVPGRGRLATPASLAAGLLAGAALLVRPDTILAAPLLAAALLVDDGAWGDRARRACAFALGCAVMAVLMMRPGLLLDLKEDDTAINAAINFYLGNNASADGHSAVFPETSELPTVDPAARADHMTGLDLAGVRYAEAQTGGGPGGVAEFWRGKAIAFIRDHPIAWLRLLARKGLLFFNGYLLATQKDLYFLRDQSFMMRSLLWCAGICFPMGLIMPLAVLGAAAPPLGRSRRLLLIAAPLAALTTTLLFFHDARFLIPAAPFLILLAAAGLSFAVDAIRSRRWAAPAALAALLVLCNVDWLGTHVVNRAAEEFRAGTMYLDDGDLEGAQAAYRRSIEADPGFVPAVDNFVEAASRSGDQAGAVGFLQGIAAAGRDTAPIARATAALLIAQGREDEATAALRRGVTRFPDDAALALDLAGLLMRRGGEAEALDLARSVIAKTTDFAQAYASAGYCLAALGRLDEAASTLREGLQHHPEDLTLLGLLGRTLGQLGRRGEEQSLYREVLRRYPSHAVAAYELARSLAADAKIEEALEYARRAQRLGHPEAAALVRELEAPAHP